MNKNRTTIYIDKTLHKEIKLLSIKKETSISGIVENMIRIYLKDNQIEMELK